MLSVALLASSCQRLNRLRLSLVPDSPGVQTALKKEVYPTTNMIPPRETRIVPRRKAGEFGASTTAKDAITLTESDIVSLFSLRQGDAARHLVSMVVEFC